jgi:hypothetical protein
MFNSLKRNPINLGVLVTCKGASKKDWKEMLEYQEITSKELKEAMELSKHITCVILDDILGSSQKIPSTAKYAVSWNIDFEPAIIFTDIPHIERYIDFE